MPKGGYEIFEALNPFFEVVMEGLRGLVDGDHYFDTTAEDAFFEFRYHFPGYGKTIKLQYGDALVVHRCRDSRVVILEYEVHGRILSNGALYDNRLISVVTIENRKIVHWRDYMDSLAAWTALAKKRSGLSRIMQRPRNVPNESATRGSIGVLHKDSVNSIPSCVVRSSVIVEAIEGPDLLSVLLAPLGPTVPP